MCFKYLFSLVVWVGGFKVGPTQQKLLISIFVKFNFVFEKISVQLL